MNTHLLLRVTAPAVAVGLVLLGACLVSVRYIHRLQRNLADALSENVSSLQAAQEMEIRVRQLRFHALLYLMDPAPGRLALIEEDQERFEQALAQAWESADTPEEQELMQEIKARYADYRREQEGLRAAVQGGQPITDPLQVADTHSLRHVIDPCHELFRINKERLAQAADDSQRVSHEGYLAMLVLGLAGPIGGLAIGFGMARAMKQSIYRLSVRVQDMAQRLNEKVASVNVVADGDIRSLDRQMQHIVHQVEAVAQRVQQQQHELLRAEQLSAVGQLAAGVAHEVRNPLTGIKLLVEAALRPNNPHPLDQEDLRVIHTEVARLEKTVQSFLDFARLPAPQKAPCDLREALWQARDLVRARARQQHVALAVETPEQPVVADVDRGQLGTVLVNLFLNALDALPGGGRLEARLEAPADGTARLAVCDSGTGIAPEVAGRLFTPFATTKPAGTGLGLSLSRRIIEEHGGAIRADNRPEGGACFTITLPLSVVCGPLSVASSPSQES